MCYLKFVLSGSMIPWKLSELLSQTEALIDILRRDKVGGNFCA
ncbi:uncharacterized protein J3R85_003783 [Psidium guajava]|nr:uncharacterized protein J3R85_003783 [Psidium guajava]